MDEDRAERTGRASEGPVGSAERTAQSSGDGDDAEHGHDAGASDASHPDEVTGEGYHDLLASDAERIIGHQPHDAE